MAAANSATAVNGLPRDMSNGLTNSGININVTTNPLLDIDNSFVVLRTDAPGVARPFILQQMGPLKYTQSAEGSELEHNEDRWEYGAKTRRGAGYGLWQHACLVTLAAS